MLYKFSNVESYGEILFKKHDVSYFLFMLSSSHLLELPLQKPLQKPAETISFRRCRFVSVNIVLAVISLPQVDSNITQF